MPSELEEESVFLLWYMVLAVRYSAELDHQAIDMFGTRITTVPPMFGSGVVFRVAPPSPSPSLEELVPLGQYDTFTTSYLIFLLQCISVR